MIYKNDSSTVSNLHLNCRYHLSFLGLSNSIPGNTIPFTKHVYNVKRYISLHIKGRFYTFLPSLSIRNVIAKIFSCELMHKNISFDFYTWTTRNDNHTHNIHSYLCTHIHSWKNLIFRYQQDMSINVKITLWMVSMASLHISIAFLFNIIYSLYLCAF